MDLRKAMGNLGMPWVNTIAADRQGTAMYADVSVVPDVDAAQLTRCAPSPQAAALRGPAGLVVLDGSRSDCGWKRDPASAVPGLTPAGTHAGGHPQRLGAEQQRRLFLQQPAAELVGHLADGGRRHRAPPAHPFQPDRVARTRGPRPGDGGRRAGAALQQPQPDGARRAARPAGRLHRAVPTPEPRTAAPRCAAGTARTTWIRAGRTCSACSGARPVRCPACTAGPSTRPSRWPRRPG
jgi:hypothetical protein